MRLLEVKYYYPGQKKKTRYCRDIVIHFYFGADLISVISVQAFFTEIKSLPKF